MTRIIRIEKCEDCFFVRNLESEHPTYCVKALTELSSYFKKKIESIKATNKIAIIPDVKKIPVWCPLEKEKIGWLKRILRRLKS